MTTAELTADWVTCEGYANKLKSTMSDIFLAARQ